MDTQVLVVGAGPVGLTMAAELARFGVSVRIVETSPSRTDKSKALVLWSRTLELLDRAGCGAAFINAGMKVFAANIVAGAHQIAHMKLDQIKTPHPYALMLPQSETERLLEEHLNRLGVQVERQVQMVHFTPDKDKVSIILKNAKGHEETMRVPWLIGCDGAHSTVRHGLNMQFEGNTLPNDWILADVHLNGGRLKQDELDIYWHSDGTLVFFPISPGRYRVIGDFGDVKPDAPLPETTLDQVQAMMDRRGPGGITASAPIWLSSFRINERKVKDYRQGRVFLAGDAAHVHSPAGGQGMNTGMQDAVNLAWKLALVCRGLAAEEPLLGSYSAERSEVGRQVLADAGHLTTLAVLKGGITQAIRNHIASLLFGLSPVREMLANKLAELSIGYPHSPLTCTDGYAHGDPAPGQRAPVSDIAFPTKTGDTPRFALHANSDSQILGIIRQHQPLLEAHPREPFHPDAIWLVRPDGYVATSAATAESAKVRDYLDQFTAAS